MPPHRHRVDDAGREPDPDEGFRVSSDVKSRLLHLAGGGHRLVPGAASGPLRGESVAVKDLFDVAGFAARRRRPGDPSESRPNTASAPAVAALVAAGADVLGIARTDEFAYSIAGLDFDYGTPPNVAAPGSLRAVPRADRRAQSRRVRCRSAWAPTPPGRSGCRRLTRACGGFAPATGRSTAPARWLAPSFAAAGWLLEPLERCSGLRRPRWTAPARSASPLRS